MELTSLEALLEQIPLNPGNRRFFYVVCPVSAAEVELVEREIGVKLLGYQHIVENYAVLHTLRKHGNPVTEAARGQLAVTPETFEIIPHIVQSFDVIRYELMKNRHSLLYEKRVGDRTYHYVAEIRLGHKKQVCAQSLWVRKTKKPTVD